MLNARRVATGMSRRRTMMCRPRLLGALVAGLALAVGTPAIGKAQQASVVRGRVLDSGGQPLQGAEVMVLPRGSRTASDYSGAFDLGVLPPGTYSIRARRIGFAPVTVEISVPLAATHLVIHMNQVAQLLDTVRSTALERDLPSVFERMREHIGATVFGPELMKIYPGLSVDEILQTDSTVWPFMRGASFPGCGMSVLIDGKLLPPYSPLDPGEIVMHTIIPDRHIREWLQIKDIAAIEVYRNAHKDVFVPGIGHDIGEGCGPTILIWTKGYKERPYKGR